MRSIKRSFTALTVSIIVSLCLVMGSVGVFFLVTQSDADATARVSLSCAKEAAGIDLLLNEVQIAVQDEVSCIIDDLRTSQIDGRRSWREGAERLFGNIASHTSGVLMYYACIEADESKGIAQDGFCYYRKSVEDDFVKKENWEDVPDNVTNKESGWHQSTLQSGQPLWIEPIDFANNGTRTAIYVAPVMVDGVYRGYVALGTDFSFVEQQVASSKLYGNGYAYLVDAEENVMYHPILKVGSNLHGDNETIPEVDDALATAKGAGSVITYRYRGEDKRMTFQVLRNGMRLVVTANAAEIYQQRNQLVKVLITIGVVAVLLSVALTMRLVRYVLTPLRNLTEAAWRTARGEVDACIVAPDVEEVAELAKAYNKTVRRMREQIELIEDLAHVDQLTGLKNRTAFYESVQALDARIDAGEDVRFEVTMFDVNDLKPVNDKYGHKAGDALLRRVAQFLSGAFEGLDVYRFGGDEFVLIAPDALGDLEPIMTSGDVSIAWGQAQYRKGKDENMMAVLGRADAVMYERKRRMKRA